MLGANTRDPQWTTCHKETTPFDFYKSLTLENSPPTAAQVVTFEASPACNTVYAVIQAALKSANCDEIQICSVSALRPVAL
ncbi:hypothetical protein ACHHYP_20793 [Achlya hypogyna]|uniref:Uncharacterized protein n=1 Tax=Achlya hypogyna TaxID=1202772 RepID=A0A1V9Y9N7_ACHHY|nr:hypothetical protein ACHHYP_20793 [Achlya hypogyna]